MVFKGLVLFLCVVCCVCMCVWYLKDWFWLCVWLERRELVHIARSIYCQYWLERPQSQLILLLPASGLLPLLLTPATSSPPPSGPLPPILSLYLEATFLILYLYIAITESDGPHLRKSIKPGGVKPYCTCCTYIVGLFTHCPVCTGFRTVIKQGHFISQLSSIDGTESSAGGIRKVLSFLQQNNFWLFLWEMTYFWLLSFYNIYLGNKLFLNNWQPKNVDNRHIEIIFYRVSHIILDRWWLQIALFWTIFRKSKKKESLKKFV